MDAKTSRKEQTSHHSWKYREKSTKLRLVAPFIRKQHNLISWVLQFPVFYIRAIKKNSDNNETPANYFFIIYISACIIHRIYITEAQGNFYREEKGQPFIKPLKQSIIEICLSCERRNIEKRHWEMKERRNSKSRNQNTQVQIWHREISLLPLP